MCFRSQSVNITFKSYIVKLRDMQEWALLIRLCFEGINIFSRLMLIAFIYKAIDPILYEVNDFLPPMAADLEGPGCCLVSFFKFITFNIRK